ncbi:DUF928 domain-containing protein [cf. Phormidesmis sp. LEGE 11477]|uniref:DUF928 domain-containing protein n=1 Tax=cf. Phormidesmis sp. LEGE 11477 TaxID=1828680 RepID=UPI00187E6A7E|nr:DUF928 domain-containing protein [cf. Phormidesmis sp. LEGE 11477]MBE9062652.1 DUF928 domain-containing protein [cf. Phormidesmis sp. LEGE 11477]
MKQYWTSGTIGAVALVIGTAWTQIGSASATVFRPPADNAAPRVATGGASRGSFFTPSSDNSAPRQATGGASRDSFFTPSSDNAAPQQATGGASRDSFFTPSSDNAAPQQATGGASRGEFFTPPTDAFPQETAGGASRGLFPGANSEAGATSGSTSSNLYGRVTPATASSAAESMLAVVPDSFYGTTLEARPTILVYVPASNTNTAVFSLKDEAKHTVYQTTVAVPESGGVVAVEMPDEAPELAVSENYQWYVALHVEGELTPGSPFVDGWIKRIEPSSELSVALAQGEGLSDVEALGQNGVWYDTAAQLASLQEGTQADGVMAGHWYELLEAVGLADIATEPIVM